MKSAQSKRVHRQTLFWFKERHIRTLNIKLPGRHVISEFVFYFV